MVSVRQGCFLLTRKLSKLMSSLHLILNQCQNPPVNLLSTKETEPVFTDEQIALYETKIRKWLQLCIDSGYVSWMSIHHPGVLPSSSGADRSSDGDTSDMAEGDWSYSPELFSTPSGVPSPDGHPGMAHPLVLPLSTLE